MTVRVGRQLRIDEDIQGFGDDQLLALVWMGIIMDDPRLQPRLRQFREEIARRGLLEPDLLDELDKRIES